MSNVLRPSIIDHIDRRLDNIETKLDNIKVTPCPFHAEMHGDLKKLNSFKWQIYGGSAVVLLILTIILKVRLF
jgi:hypothetical protein